MPFTQVAHETMMRALLGGEGLMVGIGPDTEHESTDARYQRQPVHFELKGCTNDVEVLFPRQSAAGEISHWFLFDKDERLIAHDRVSEPVMPAAGHRVVFPPGTLRLGLVMSDKE